MAKTNISATIDANVVTEAQGYAKAENRTFSNYLETATIEANKKRKRKTSAKPVYSTKKHG